MKPKGPKSEYIYIQIQFGKIFETRIDAKMFKADVSQAYFECRAPEQYSVTDID
jgi:hypothetical protein